VIELLRGDDMHMLQLEVEARHLINLLIYTKVVHQEGIRRE